MATGQAERETGVSAKLDIRILTQVAEFEACVHLQQTIWGFADLDLVPRRVFVVARKIGGLVLGAFDGERMAGFAMALPGHRPGQTYWHSHMLAVDAPYREHGLGRRLKLRQREEALTQGIELIEWTFDPLEIKNSYFNLERLGAITRRYHPDLYGTTSSLLQGGLPTDRLTAEWWLHSPRVVALATAGAAAASPFLSAVEVPVEIADWKSKRDPRAAVQQARIREALAAAFAAGQVAVGYERRPDGGAFRLGVGEPL